MFVLANFLYKKNKSCCCQKQIEDTLFGDISGIGIPELLLNIVPCYVFVQEKNATLILMCRSKLVSCHINYPKVLWCLINIPNP